MTVDLFTLCLYIFLAVLLDEQSVEQKMKELEERFSDLVNQAYKALLKRKVDKNVRSFRSIFLSQNIYTKNSFRTI